MEPAVEQTPDGQPIIPLTEALRLAKENQKRYEDGTVGGGLALDRKKPNSGGKVGNGDSGTDTYGVAVVKVLSDNNDQYLWNPEDPFNGVGTFNNIYQALAADMYAPNGSIKDRVKAGEDYEKCARRGIAAVREWLARHNLTLFACTHPEHGSRVVQLTLDPHCIVNEKGETAFEVQYSRDANAAKGALRSMYRKQVAVLGKVNATKALTQVLADLNEATVKSLPPTARLERGATVVRK